MAVRKKKKKPVGQLNLQIAAGSANPSPPVGPALGQRGINIMEFCKAFNERTSGEEKGVPLPVTIEYYEDKSFTFTVRTPPASYLLRQAAGLKKGSETPGRATAGTVSFDVCRSIARRKLADLNTDDVEAGARMIAGSARAMGLHIEEAS